MSSARLRTVSVDLPDALVRRAARHAGPQAGFGTIMERALELWLAREEAGSAKPRHPRAEPAATAPRQEAL